jgi:subtilisin family serine protease
LKPNVSAPGVNVESSLSSFRDGTYAVTEEVQFDGMTYEFAKLSGTSMSSPAVAGIVALMLEANPSLSPSDVRDILQVTARQDQATGALPEEGDVEWGHGKVNAFQALLAALNWVSLVGHPSLPNNPTGQDLMAQPNPAREAVLVSGNLSAQSTYRLVDTRGRAWREGPAAPMFRIDLQSMPPGVYVVMAWDPERQTSHTTRVVKTH